MKIKKNELKGKTILLIDSPDKKHFWLKDLIVETEVNLILETDWKNSVELCKIDKSIDLVLIDIDFQTMNGLEAIRQILEFNNEFPIIGLLDRENRQDFTNKEFLKFISKPIYLTEFFSTVETIFSDK